MSRYFTFFTQNNVDSLLVTREGEVKLGEEIRLLRDSENWQQQLENSDSKFVLLGIPEDIGVRANGGIGGADTAWLPALKALLNIQSTPSFKGDELLPLGAFDFSEWMQQSEHMDLAALRELTAQIDNEVYPLIEQIVRAGKIPIIIGGGHNNAYGLLKGSSLGLGKAVNCINLDAHSDYRRMEGRHSGNGFRYAKSDSFLARYAIVGLHENYNAANIITELTEDKTIYFSTYEDIFIQEKFSFQEAVGMAVDHTNTSACGIELDLDCIEHVLSSATSPVGISTLQARQFVYTCAQTSNACYLHLTEGAAQLRDGRQSNTTGKLIAYLITDFIKGFGK